MILAAVATAAPLPMKTRPPITAANAEKLRPVEQLDKAVYTIVRGPGRGELAFVMWEMPEPQKLKVLKSRGG
jgi:hypothetical protein